MSEKISDWVDHTIIPAPPGYWVWLIDRLDGELFMRLPLIAWVVGRRRCDNGTNCFWWKQVVTPEEVVSDDQPHAIEWPTGEIEFPEDCVVEHLPAARIHAKRDAEIAKEPAKS